jgi:uncharacterized repeat protein (TIGR03803 family)
MGRMKQVCTLAAAAIASMCAALAPASAAKLTVLYSFCAKTSCTDGSVPRGDLFLDAAGDLYGLATGGGANGRGVAFRLSRASGKWKYQRLYSFCAKSDCRDGGLPDGKIVFDAGGNFYGVTFNPGTVFALMPNANRSRWSIKTLHLFCQKAACADGARPTGGLTYPGAENGALYDAVSPLYGETFAGGSSDQGTIFSLTPEIGTGRWTHRKLHDFCTETEDCDLTDGSQPNGGLLIDQTGNLFGASAGGGPDFSGTIFEFSPRQSGKWKEQIPYAFCAPGCDAGQSPTGIIRDEAGNAYGTTTSFGPNGKGGTLFELAADGTFNLLHAFCSAADCADGHQPGAAPIRDAAGNLYGTTIIGGGHDIDDGHLGGGVVFERAASGDFTVLYAFCAEAHCADGAAPWAGLTMDSAGNLFGTTSGGGKHGGGTIFEVTP